MLPIFLTISLEKITSKYNPCKINKECQSCIKDPSCGYKKMKILDQNCRKNKDCHSCVKDPMCGFCALKGICVHGTENGPSYFPLVPDNDFSLNDKKPCLLNQTLFLESLYFACKIKWIYATDPSKCPSSIKLNFNRITNKSNSQEDKMDNILLNENEISF